MNVSCDPMQSSWEQAAFPLRPARVAKRASIALRQVVGGRMRTGPREERRPADVIGIAIVAGQIATGLSARASKLATERRSEVAKKAASRRGGGE